MHNYQLVDAHTYMTNNISWW